MPGGPCGPPATRSGHARWPAWRPRDARIRRLILIALPVSVYDCAFIAATTQPGLLIFGSGDEFGTATELVQRHPDLPERLEVEEIPGADHFFRGRTPLVEEAVRTYALEHQRIHD